MACLEHFQIGRCQGRLNPLSKRYKWYNECRWTNRPDHVAMVRRYRADFPVEDVP